MKKLLLLQAFVLVFGFSVSAQQQERPEQQEIVSDSLTAAYAFVDTLSLFQLQKGLEAYTYKCRTEPTDFNKAMLAYIEKRIIAVK